MIKISQRILVRRSALEVRVFQLPLTSLSKERTQRENPFPVKAQATKISRGGATYRASKIALI
jgi:hypothetical protein